MAVQTRKQMAATAARTADFLASPASVESLLMAVAEGATLAEACTRVGIVYATARRHLIQYHGAAYDAVKHVMADMVLDEIAALERQLAAGQIEERTFKELTASKRWRVEKMNPARFGQRQNVDMRVTDTSKLHLDAVRALSRRPRPSLGIAYQSAATDALMLPAPIPSSQVLPDDPVILDSPTCPDNPTDPDSPTYPDSPTDPDSPTNPTDPDSPTDPTNLTASDARPVTSAGRTPPVWRFRL